MGTYHQEGDNFQLTSEGFVMLHEETRKPNIIRTPGRVYTPSQAQVIIDTTTAMKKSNPATPANKRKSTKKHVVKANPNKKSLIFSSPAASTLDTLEVPTALSQTLTELNGSNYSLEYNFLDEGPSASRDGSEVDQLMQAAIGADGGSYMVLMDGNEIIQLSSDNYPENPDETFSFGSDYTQDAPVENLYDQYESGVSRESDLSNDPNCPYVIIELPDGSQLLMPASSLQTSVPGAEQEPEVLVTDNDSLLQMLQLPLPTSDSSVAFTNTFNNYNFKSKKTRKRTNNKNAPVTSAVNNMQNSRIAIEQRIATNKRPALIHKTSSTQDLRLTQATNGNISSVTSSKIRPKKSSPEVKPKPFRFEIPEGEDMELDFPSSVSLVIENFRKYKG